MDASIRFAGLAFRLSGMTVGEANDAGVPTIYLKRMAAAGHLKID